MNTVAESNYGVSETSHDFRDRNIDIAMCPSQNNFEIMTGDPLHIPIDLQHTITIHALTDGITRSTWLESFFD
jgi:hypothetical protein